MAYADTLRSTTFTGSDIATLIEGIFVSGFPLAWTTYSPSYAASGSMTWTTVTTNMAKYIQVGKLVIFYVDATGTTGGTASTDLTISLPVTAASPGGLWAAAVAVTDSTVYAGTNRISSTCNVRKYDSSNFALGAGRRVQTAGFYEST